MENLYNNELKKKFKQFRIFRIRRFNVISDINNVIVR